MSDSVIRRMRGATYGGRRYILAATRNYASLRFPRYRAVLVRQLCYKFNTSKINTPNVRRLSHRIRNPRSAFSDKGENNYYDVVRIS